MNNKRILNILKVSVAGLLTILFISNIQKMFDARENHGEEIVKQSFIGVIIKKEIRTHEHNFKTIDIATPTGAITFTLAFDDIQFFNSILLGDSVRKISGEKEVCIQKGNKWKCSQVID